MGSHNGFLVSVFYFAIILVAAKVASEICVKLKQPAVLGEILIGALIGIIPWMRGTLTDVGIGFISELGVMLLLFEVGLESETSKLMKVGVQATLVGVVGVVLPFLAGMGATLLMGYSLYESIFMGGVLTATSIGITARVFRDLKVLAQKSAQIVIGAAVVDDVLGLIVLSIILGFATPGVNTIHPILKIAIAVLFLVGSVWIGQIAAPYILSLVKRMKSRGTLTVAAFVFCLLLGGIGALPVIGLAPIVGAFCAGLILASTEERIPIADRIRPAADLFVPVFFVMIGMKLDLSLFGDPVVVGLAAVLFVCAVPTKLVAGFVARSTGVDRVLVGIGMIPRGEVGLIFASIGLSAGLLNLKMYSAAVVALLLTTIITPPWLKMRLAMKELKAGS
jgi:Kef-type K+ transport system membrane component KefB